jgi:hypothetical protein
MRRRASGGHTSVVITAPRLFVVLYANGAPFRIKLRTLMRLKFLCNFQKYCAGLTKKGERESSTFPLPDLDTRVDLACSAKPA